MIWPPGGGGGGRKGRDSSRVSFLLFPMTLLFYFISFISFLIN